MDTAELSSWLGKPPNMAKRSQSNEASDRTASGSRPATSEGSLSSSGDSEQKDGNSIELIDSSSEEEDRLSSRVGDLSFAKSMPQQHADFYIDVPEIPDKDDYEHLTGHFVVDRVISQYPQQKYLVKLQSGEIDLVSFPGLPLPHF